MGECECVWDRHRQAAGGIVLIEAVASWLVDGSGRVGCYYSDLSYVMRMRAWGQRKQTLCVLVDGSESYNRSIDQSLGLSGYFFFIRTFASSGQYESKHTTV